MEDLLSELNFKNEINFTIEQLIDISFTIKLPLSTIKKYENDFYIHEKTQQAEKEQREQDLEIYEQQLIERNLEQQLLLHRQQQQLQFQQHQQVQIQEQIVDVERKYDEHQPIEQQSISSHVLPTIPPPILSPILPSSSTPKSTSSKKKKVRIHLKPSSSHIQTRRKSLSDDDDDLSVLTDAWIR
jgi:hypothetical protein